MIIIVWAIYRCLLHHTKQDPQQKIGILDKYNSIAHFDKSKMV